MSKVIKVVGNRESEFEPKSSGFFPAGHIEEPAVCTLPTSLPRGKCLLPLLLPRWGRSPPPTSSRGNSPQLSRHMGKSLNEIASTEAVALWHCQEKGHLHWRKRRFPSDRKEAAPTRQLPGHPASTEEHRLPAWGDPRTAPTEPGQVGRPSSRPAAPQLTAPYPTPLLQPPGPATPPLTVPSPPAAPQLTAPHLPLGPMTSPTVPLPACGPSAECSPAAPEASDPPIAPRRPAPGPVASPS